MIRQPVTLESFLAHRRRRALIPRSFEIFASDLLIFGLGAAGAFTLEFVGSLPVCELLVLMFLPFALPKSAKAAFRREYRWFYILLGLWLLGTIVNDIYLGVEPTNRIKGMARIIFLGLDFIMLAIIIKRRPRRIIVFALSICAVMASFFLRYQSTFDTRWKFGGSSCVTILALLLASHFYKKSKYAVSCAICCGVGLLNLLLAFRSQLGMDLLTGLFVLPIMAAPSRSSRTSSVRATHVMRVVLVLALAGSITYLAMKAVTYAARHGFFEESISEKFESQSQGKYGVLLGGRPETLVAIQAIRDSPIVGHGSYANDPKYLVMLDDLQYEYNYSASDYVEDLENPGIPTHSHLTLAWVESGIMGGVFWIYILLLAIYGIVLVLRLRPPLTPLYIYLLLNFVWDVLYSPMGAANRIWNAFTILLCYYLIMDWKKGKRPVPRFPGIKPYHRKRADPAALRHAINGRVLSR